MAGLSLNTLVARSPRRVRLLFSKTLAAAAFTSTSYYSVTNTDGAGTSPAVAAVLAISDTPFAAELVLSDDLVSGGVYTVSAVGVPALDASTTPDPSSLPLNIGLAPAAASADLSTDDTLALLYGRDIIFQDGDLLEGPDGDLATQSGPENAKAALMRAMVSDGLPHDPTYGAHPREFVDAPFTALGTLPTKVQRVLQADDRVKQVKSVEVEDPDPLHPERVTISADVELIGGLSTNISADLNA